MRFIGRGLTVRRVEYIAQAYLLRMVTIGYENLEATMATDLARLAAME